MKDPLEASKERWRKRRREIILANVIGLSCLLAVFLFLIGLPASQTYRTLKSRELVIPTKTEHHFDPNALVALFHVTAYPGSSQIRFNSSGFVIGDGSLIATAAHCVDIENRKQEAMSHGIYVASAYYGDVFPCKLVATDPKLDLALLRPNWSEHPALVLGTEQELASAPELWVASRSFNDKTAFRNTSPQSIKNRALGLARMESLPVKSVGRKKGLSLIKLGDTRFVVGGWSGSPIINPANGHLVGLTIRLRQKYGLGVFKQRDAIACGIETIRHFLQKHQMLSQASAPSPTLAPVPHAAAAYEILRRFPHTFNSDIETAYHQIQTLVSLRPESPVAHQYAALMAAAFFKREPELESFKAMAIDHLQQSVTLNNQNPHGLAFAGEHMQQYDHPNEVWRYSQQALSLDPNNELALYNSFLHQRSRDPNLACELARELTHRHPQIGDFWRHYSDILYQLERYPAAVDAAQHAIASNPKGLYGRLLARALEKCGRLDEAQDTFETMIRDCACQSCWLDYANFLLDHRTRNTEGLILAKRAVAAMETSKNRESSSKRRKTRLKLLKAQLALQPDHAKHWYRYAQYLLRHDPNNRAKIEEALTKAADPNNIEPVHESDLAELQERFTMKQRGRRPCKKCSLHSL